ncbi:MAG: DUF4926 domain-containing protein [Oscillospiraceae bacterium]|nr:DUF4926 domain-containing protein [Oscillospiraceae bacterium]
MKIEMFQKIRLKSGKVGRVVEIFNEGEAYMVDLMSDDGEYEQKTIHPPDIKSIVVEIDKPFTSTA